MYKIENVKTFVTICAAAAMLTSCSQKNDTNQNTQHATMEESATAPVSLGTFVLLNEIASSGNELSLPFQSSQQGEPLGLFWASSASYELFNVLSVGNNQYEIADNTGGLCLTVNGSAVSLQTCSGVGQSFTFSENSDQSYTIQSSGLCLTAAGAFSSVTSATCNSANAGQKWQFSGSVALNINSGSSSPAPASSPSVSPSSSSSPSPSPAPSLSASASSSSIGTFVLLNEIASSGNELSLPYQSSVQGESVALFWASSASYELFNVLSVGNNQYEIAENMGGRCLTINGSAVSLQTCGGAGQSFTLSENSDQSYSIQSSGLCMTASGAFSSVTFATCSSANAGQKWQFSGSVALNVNSGSSSPAASPSSSASPSASPSPSAAPSASPSVSSSSSSSSGQNNQGGFVSSSGGAPTIYEPSSAVAPGGGSAVIGVVVTSHANDILSVALTADSVCKSGSSLAIVSGTIVYTPCPVTAAGNTLVSYVVTDSSNNTSVSGSYSVQLAIDDTTAANNPTVIYNGSAPLPHFSAALAAVKAGTAGARARIITLGDSCTQGHGDELASSSFQQGQGRSYPELLAADLSSSGVVAVDNSAYSPSNSLNSRITFVGGTGLNGLSGAGGSMADTQSAGDGFDYNTASFPAFDRVDVLYNDGSGSFTVSVDGGPVQCTINESNTGGTVNSTCSVSAGVHSVVSIRQSGSTGTFFQGLAVWSSTAPKVELLNVGIGGSFTVSLDVTNPPPQYNYGQMEAAYALTPQLALLKFATNDIANNTTLNTTGSNTTVEQMAINYQQGITSMKEAGVDPVIVISEPLASANYATLMPAWRAAAVQLAYANNVPLIDLSATYENDFNALPHLDALHPNEQGYIDMAQTFNRFFESLP